MKRRGGGDETLCQLMDTSDFARSVLLFVGSATFSTSTLCRTQTKADTVASQASLSKSGSRPARLSCTFLHAQDLSKQCTPREHKPDRPLRSDRRCQHLGSESLHNTSSRTWPCSFSQRGFASSLALADNSSLHTHHTHRSRQTGPFHREQHPISSFCPRHHQLHALFSHSWRSRHRERL